MSDEQDSGHPTVTVGLLSCISWHKEASIINYLAMLAFALRRKFMR